MIATCSDGYVFIDDENADGELEFVNLYPVRSRTPIICEADEALAENGWVRVTDWAPTKVAAQIRAEIEHVN